jgi:hypothetical protein
VVRKSEVKDKTKFTLRPPIKPNKGAELYRYSFFDLSARWRWVVKATPQSLHPGKEIRYLIYRRLDRP